ncbi:MAG: VOC family protein [Rhodospirillaceae bacterium]|nr:VOC family protein [Rhodospirillaceae bacterium]
MKLGYVILYVPDVAAAVSFYEQAFGVAVRFVHESGLFAEMETGETALAFTAESLLDGDNLGYRPLRADSPSPGAELAFVTEDVAAALDRAIAAGAILVKAPEDKPWGQTVAYVRDPHGFLVELCTPVG